jgi:carbon-monoxide dehydrogenase small subunit
MNVIPTRSSLDLRCTVNGRPAQVAIAAHALLLDVLRDLLDLKGAKRSCDQQVCGACTVLVDGLPVSACTYLAIEVEGREILTVEGLAQEDRLDPLQEAFIDHGAVQCGFCTAGMLLTARALLAEEPSPGPEAVLDYLRGSLCRCTGYRKIVEAILACAAPGSSASSTVEARTPPPPGSAP